jgi:DNA-binding Lrp family transcriptional regulator
MDKQERWWMDQKDRDRLKVLHEVEQGHLTQVQAGEQLGLSARWIRKLVKRRREEGDRGIVHRLRGRVSNRRLPEARREQVIRTVKERYGDFGPSLAAEYLERREGIRISREALRQIMIQAGIWKGRKRRSAEVHTWRPRRSCWGELLQWDTSEHAWLEGRGEKLYLIAMLDDATSRAYARLVRHDSTEENLRMLQGYLEQWGRPWAFYTDKASLFRVNRPASREEQLQGQEARTQIGRGLEELGIEWIAAHSPQAKGRIERCFGTFQDRLVKGLRLAGARTLEQANAYLEEEFLPEWEERFTRPAANATNAHRPLGAEHDLAAILSVVESRVVGNDYTLRWEGKTYQIARADIRAGLRGARVRVEQRLDGTLAVRFRDRYLQVTLCSPQPAPSRHPAPIRLRAEVKQSRTRQQQRAGRDWMKSFRLPGTPVFEPIRAPVKGRS